MQHPTFCMHQSSWITTERRQTLLWGLPSNDEGTTTTSSRNIPNIENVNHDYIPAPDAGPITSALTKEQIDFLIASRLESKKVRNFEKADATLAYLNKAGVHLQDKRKEWRADGQNHFGREARVERDAHVRRGSSYDLTEADLIDVADLVARREQAKRRREYHLSDELGDTLKTKYRVKVNNKKREWSVIIKDGDGDSSTPNGLATYIPSPLAPPDDPTHTMNDESKALIQKRLADRVVARNDKDYKMADLIRDELMNDYSVVIDDVTREYKVVTGDGESDQFVREAQDSQRSPFVRKTNESDDSKEWEKETDFLLTNTGTDDVETMSQDTPLLVKDDTPDITSAVPTVTIENEEDSNLATLTVVMLKEKLRNAGLPVSGKKAELIDRLMKASYGV
jgi:hypothetical protein